MGVAIITFLNWEDKKEKGVYSGKIFEYLAAQRPILSTGGFGSDVVEKLLKETKAGVYCPTVDSIKGAVEKFYLEYKNKGNVVYTGNWEKASKYNQREMAKKFAVILNKITK